MHPILFEIPTPWGPLPIYSYGVMLGTSMILGWSIVMFFGKRERYFADEKKNDDFLANAFIVCALSAILGARILYMITNPNEFPTPADWFALRRGGLVAYGGFLGGFIAAIVYVRQMHGVGLLRFSDGAAPALALGLGLTRIGCYLYGCDFGARLPDDAPGWLVSAGTFPHWGDDTGSPAWSHHVQEYDLAFDADHAYPVHPTQLYESSIGILLFALCMFVWSRRQFHGQVLLTLTMAYGVWRFLIEYVRDDPERGAAFGFSTSQWISLALIPLAGFSYFAELQRWKQKPYKVVKLFDPAPSPQLATAGGPAVDAEDDEDAKGSEEPAKSSEDADEASETPAKASDEAVKTSGKKGGKKKK
jgi:phosphatidylglycerol:prolipoprotein diacylglycerol transferase